MRLNLSPGEARYQLFPESDGDPGIFIMALPALSEVVEEAKADPSMLAFAETLRDMIDADPERGPDDSLRPEDFRSQRKVGLILAKAIARQVIVGWGGVEDPDGTAAPVTPDRIDALLDLAPVYDKFTEVYLTRWLTVQAEKNDSAPSPTGTSEGAPNTADRARRSVKAARAG